VFSDHNSPRNHHDFTSKLPSKNTHYLPDPPKKHQQNSKNSAFQPPNIFSAKSLKHTLLKTPAEGPYRSKINTT
jgi:hypothetical protein